MRSRHFTLSARASNGAKALSLLLWSEDCLDPHELQRCPPPPPSEPAENTALCLVFQLSFVAKNTAFALCFHRLRG